MDMGKDNENHRLLELIERIATVVSSEERTKVEDALFRDVHLRSLHYLARCNRYSNTPSALGAFLGTTKGTVSQSIKVLEERGLVEKFEDGEDRRVIRLRLTKKGRSFIDQNVPRDALEGVLVKSLSKQESHLLSSLLLKSLKAIQESTKGRMFGVCVTCRHFNQNGLGAQHQCGLTKEPLSERESALICREHEIRPT